MALQFQPYPVLQTTQAQQQQLDQQKFDSINRALMGLTEMAQTQRQRNFQNEISKAQEARTQQAFTEERQPISSQMPWNQQNAPQMMDVFNQDPSHSLGVADKPTGGFSTDQSSFSDLGTQPGMAPGQTDMVAHYKSLYPQGRPQTMFSPSTPGNQQPDFNAMISNYSPRQMQLMANAAGNFSAIAKAPSVPSEIQSGIDYRNSEAAKNYATAEWMKNRPTTTGVTTGTISWDNATPQQQNLAEAMVKGNVLPGDLGMRDRATIVTLANEYALQNGIPFQSYGGNVRKGMAENLAYGKIGMNSLSLNTALGHVGDALTAYQNLGSTDINLLNRPINWLKKNTNDPNVVALGINLNALQGELANVFKNSGGTDQEIAKWSTYLNENLTPDQFRSAAQKVGELLNSRLNAMKYQQSNVMNQGPTERQLLSPHGADIMNRVTNPPTATTASDGRVHTATNPRTGQRIITTDGGQTWRPVQ